MMSESLSDRTKYRFVLLRSGTRSKTEYQMTEKPSGVSPITVSENAGECVAGGNQGRNCD